MLFESRAIRCGDNVDEDGTGEIEFAEFLRAFEKQRGGQQETVFVQAWTSHL